MMELESNRQSPSDPVDDDACFACGSRNPEGLGLHFEPDGSDGARGRLVLAPHLQGYRGIAHGGVVMLLLDEVMAHAAGNAGDRVMTAAVAVRFRAPVPLGVAVLVAGRVISKRGKILKIEGSVRAVDGAVLATAEGSFVSLGPIEPGRFGNSGGRVTV
jgi:acyl-coenzyme A thioesterase PaaI-like protein